MSKAKISFNENRLEWMEFKWSFAEKLVNDWLKNQIPILVVVEESTENASSCYLAGCVLQVAANLGITPQISLVHNSEDKIIDHYESEHKVIWELDEHLAYRP